MSTSRISEERKSSLAARALGYDEPVTEEDLDWYEQHPEDLDVVVNKELIQIEYLRFFFIVSLVLIAASRTISVLWGDALGSFMNHVVLDVISEFGIALLGGIVTAYFLEVLQKRQYETNMRYRKEVQQRLEERARKREANGANG